MANPNNRNILSSWKEIANYLNCSVRTCKRWEENYGLPIHRIDKKSKTTVYAYKEELDTWLKRQKKEESSSSLLRWFKKPYMVPVLFLVAAVLVYFLFIRKTQDPRPADFKIKNSELIILNPDGKELWRYDTKIENLCQENSYRKHFQFKRRKKETMEKNFPHLIIKDINNDLIPEVLFTLQTQDEYGEGKLFCFNHKGNLLWKHKIGRELQFGQKIYSNDYRIFGIDLFDLNDDKNQEIITISAHKHFFPTQLAILNHQGKKQGEYWNSGRLADYAFLDLNKDEIKEIVISGMNNEYKKGCLIVFDPRMVKGSSPQSGYYKCRKLEPGTEKYYLLFPRTDVDRQEYLIDKIASIDVFKNRRLSLQTKNSNIFFELNFNLEVEDVRLSHQFELMHRKAVSENRIHSKLNQEYRENLAQGVLYYNGKKWVSEPTMTAYWKNKLSKQ